jgi:acetate kinase
MKTRIRRTRSAHAAVIHGLAIRPLRQLLSPALRAYCFGVDGQWTSRSLRRAVISSPDSRVAGLVIPTNEELMIAMHTQALATANNVLS